MTYWNLRFQKWPLFLKLLSSVRCLVVHVGSLSPYGIYRNKRKNTVSALCDMSNLFSLWSDPHCTWCHSVWCIMFYADLECHQDLVQSFSWKGDGSLLVTSSKVSIFIFFYILSCTEHSGLDICSGWFLFSG